MPTAVPPAVLPEISTAAPSAIGVAPCDQYLERYARCIARWPPGETRVALQDALTATWTAWHEAAAGPGRDGLPMTCAVAMDAARISLGQQCDWGPPPRSTALDPFGVHACDDYVAKMRRCIDTRVPEHERAPLYDALDETMLAWQDALAGPARSFVVKACRDAHRAAKRRMAPYRCKW